MTAAKETIAEPLRRQSGIADITRQKRAEAALASREELYRQIAEESPLALAIVDSTGSITFVNRQTERLFGYRRDELLGQPIADILPPVRRADAGDKVAKAPAPVIPLTTGPDEYVNGRHRDELNIPLEISVSRFRTHLAVQTAISMTDAAPRLRAEQAMQMSVEEKETLLKEIHHRVKNNMQLISSLLKLQCDYVHDPVALDVLREGQNRVRSMALIHEKLYKRSSLTRIEFRDYVESLINLLNASFHAPADQVRLVMELTPANLTIDTAIPLGLILNELVSNALKHAFPEARPGEIRISLQPQEDDGYELVVADNGVGLPPALDWKNSPTLGLRLVRILSVQLGGEPKLITNEGTLFRLRFHDTPTEALT